jgi:tryptophan halogenase
MGLASGFLEPLESTSIYLVQAAIQHLVPLLNASFDDGRAQAVFNRLMEGEYDPVRDFLVLHYRATARTEPLWQYTRTMAVPDSLTERMALFRHRGHIEAYSVGLFSPPSWLAVYVGQDVVPDGHDHVADALPADMLARKLASLRSQIAGEVSAMDSHEAVVRGYVAERERAVS